ncbi:unnamed protein product [Cylicocyclus nassatus]|uniref:Secreted protein n=1 Tax=Cylicocyclus nassatus TaxID=53992 RepID=A0AA36DNT4_CYLNA|nr:unnamed protein product [Cylicocyclus nassatus]
MQRRGRARSFQPLLVVFVEVQSVRTQCEGRPVTHSIIEASIRKLAIYQGTEHHKSIRHASAGGRASPASRQPAHGESEQQIDNGAPYRSPPAGIEGNSHEIVAKAHHCSSGISYSIHCIHFNSLLTI